MLENVQKQLQTYFSDGMHLWNFMQELQVEFWTVLSREDRLRLYLVHCYAQFYNDQLPLSCYHLSKKIWRIETPDGKMVGTIPLLHWIDEC